MGILCDENSIRCCLEYADNFLAVFEEDLYRISTEKQTENCDISFFIAYLILRLESTKTNLRCLIKKIMEITHRQTFTLDLYDYACAKDVLERKKTFCAINKGIDALFFLIFVCFDEDIISLFSGKTHLIYHKKQNDLQSAHHNDNAADHHVSDLFKTANANRFFLKNIIGFFNYFDSMLASNRNNSEHLYISSRKFNVDLLVHHKDAKGDDIARCKVPEIYFLMKIRFFRKICAFF